MHLSIQLAKADDTEDVLRINRDAFGGDEGVDIAELVADLLADPSAEPRFSFLALCDGEAVGHILFSHAQLLESDGAIRISLLAPLAVVPAFQARGIGGALIKEGLSRLAQAGIEAVFVLGHPGYYPRYGFQRACPRGFHALYQEPGTTNDAWMVRELIPGVLNSVSGGIQCADVLNHVRHWRE